MFNGKYYFRHHDNQNISRKEALFIIWCALNGNHVDMGAFIICHLMEVAKTTSSNIIGGGCTITAIA